MKMEFFSTMFRALGMAGKGLLRQPMLLSLLLEVGWKMRVSSQFFSFFFHHLGCHLNLWFLPTSISLGLLLALHFCSGDLDINTTVIECMFGMTMVVTATKKRKLV
ncbi:hypothetical protein KSP39_PZI021974 [Platanthera zijinensis]|uniref:Uncharacterized protein n=1 Tax=Platanthera zijinensis TaxID=2320716 RepID=A0AAP0AYS3_9ASPA